MPEIVNIRFIKAHGLFNGGEVAGFSEAEAKELCNPFNPQSSRIASWVDKEREAKVQKYIKTRQVGEIQREAAQSIRKKHLMDEYAYDPGRLQEMEDVDLQSDPPGRSVKNYEELQADGKQMLDDLLHPIMENKDNSILIHEVIMDLNKEDVNPNLSYIVDELKERDVKLTQKEIQTSLTFMIENGWLILDPEQPKNKKHYIAKEKKDD